jgi:hypothetical protein
VKFHELVELVFFLPLLSFNPILVNLSTKPTIYGFLDNRF